MGKKLSEMNRSLITSSAKLKEFKIIKKNKQNNINNNKNEISYEREAQEFKSYRL